jgi:hypothetical protein
VLPHTANASNCQRELPELIRVPSTCQPLSLSGSLVVMVIGGDAGIQAKPPDSNVVPAGHVTVTLLASVVSITVSFETTWVASVNVPGGPGGP